MEDLTKELTMLKSVNLHVISSFHILHDIDDKLYVRFVLFDDDEDDFDDVLQAIIDIISRYVLDEAVQGCKINVIIPDGFSVQGYDLHESIIIHHINNAIICKRRKCTIITNLIENYSP